MKKLRPICLLTDYGLHDHYVGAMKGVIETISPGAKVIDISHEVKPQMIDQGAYLLWAAFPFLPEGSVVVAVVDPGVGSGRRILCIEMENRILLAPENGLAEFVQYDFKVKHAFNVANSQLFLEHTSSTFHGRDIFAPVAAHLAKGIRLKKVGPEIILPDVKSPFIETLGNHTAKVLHIDRFGNIITNVRIDKKYFLNAIMKRGRTTIRQHVRSYKEIAPGTVAMLQGSSNLIGISTLLGNAAKQLGVHVGDTFEIRI